jgi:uncharacterized protein (TIGR04255 family)
MERRVYPRPPIVEAIIDMRLAMPVDAERLIRALETLPQYTGPHEVHDLFQFSARVEKEATSTSTTRTPHITFLRTKDGLRRIGCGIGILSVHVLAPYPGWESFREQALEAVERLPLDVRHPGLNSIAVRYVDRIGFPLSPLAQYDEYLTLMPIKPAEMPSQLTGFHIATSSVDPVDSTAASLTLTSAPRDEQGRPNLIYDLILQRSGSPLCSLEADDWIGIVDALHTRQRAIFEDSITEKMRELFQ